jgi:hypothetical protein
LAWIHSGPPARKWEKTRRPIINLEPPYEDHVAYQSRKRHTAYNVRRASYWSLLASPTAGVSYGVHGVWNWAEKNAEPLNHQGTGAARPWHEAMALPGSTQMGHLARLFTSLPWWRLRPDPALIAAQPASDEPARFVAAARTEDRTAALIYLPAGGQIELRPDVLKGNLTTEWFDPRMGQARRAEAVKGLIYRAPDGDDWVLVFRSTKNSR